MSRGKRNNRNAKQVLSAPRTVSNPDLSSNVTRDRVFETTWNRFEIERNPDRNYLIIERHQNDEWARAQLVFTDSQLKDVAKMFEDALAEGDCGEQTIRFLNGDIQASRWRIGGVDSPDADWLRVSIENPKSGIEASYRFTKQEYLELKKLLS